MIESLGRRATCQDRRRRDRWRRISWTTPWLPSWCFWSTWHRPATTKASAAARKQRRVLVFFCCYHTTSSEANWLPTEVRKCLCNRLKEQQPFGGTPAVVTHIGHSSSSAYSVAFSSATYSSSPFSFFNFTHLSILKSIPSLILIEKGVKILCNPADSK